MELCCTKTDKWSFQHAKKKTIRLINGSKYNAHTEPIFKFLCILPLPKLIEFFYFIQGFLPISFNNVWSTNEERRSENSRHILRNSDELTIPFTRLVTRKCENIKK